MRYIEKLTSEGNYSDFEVALLIAERSFLKYNEINQDLVEKVCSIAQSYDTLFGSDINEDLDNVFDEFDEEKLNESKNITSLKELEELIENQGWEIYVDDNTWELRQYSPAGEDYFFSINHNGEVETAVSEIIDYCANGFDQEEHIKELLEAKTNGFQGVPEVSVLVEDAQDIQDMLDDLCDLVQNVEIDIQIQYKINEGELDK